MQVDLGYRPRGWQADCHRRMTRYTVLALHRRAGKTELALMELIHGALRATSASSHWAYIAPFKNQAVRIVWRRLKQRVEPLRQLGRARISEVDKVIELSNGAVIAVYGADNYDALRGTFLDGVVLDEVAQMPTELWEEVVYPQLQDRGGWALFIGTPKGVNLFSELYYAAPTRPDWSSRVYTVYDTGVFSEAQVDELRATMSEQAFAREFLCDFSASGDDQLLSIADVAMAAQRRVPKQDIEHAPRILGVDVARFGNDSSVLIRRQGLLAFGLQRWHGIDTMTLANHVANVARDWLPDAIFIDVGMGAGVIDRLRQMNVPSVMEVNFGSASSNPRFRLKRTQMWWDMAEWLRFGGQIPDDETLKRDLAAPCYKMLPSNQILLESKDELRARGLPSPDCGDALALTFAEPISPRAHQQPVDIHPEYGYRPLRYDPMQAARKLTCASR